MCQERGITDELMKAEIDDSIRVANQKLHERYSDTFRIPLFCLIDLGREDIRGAIDDLRKFERMLLPQNQFIVNFTGFGRSKLRGR